MKPLYRHIIQTIEAPFLDAYNESGEDKTYEYTPLYNSLYVDVVNYEVRSGVTYNKIVTTFSNATTTPKLFCFVGVSNGMLAVKKDMVLKVKMKCTLWNVSTTVAGGKELIKIKDLELDDSYTFLKDCNCICSYSGTGETIPEDPFTLSEHISVSPITYSGLLVDKDDSTKRIKVSSNIHVINENEELSNKNALVYFTIGDTALHGIDVNTKFIWSIYQEDRKGYWTSKSPAFRVVETNIIDTPNLQ